MFCEKQSFLRNEFHDNVLLPPYFIFKWTYIRAYQTTPEGGLVGLINQF